jgi:hypothetical protein
MNKSASLSSDGERGSEASLLAGFAACFVISLPLPAPTPIHFLLKHGRPRRPGPAQHRRTARPQWRLPPPRPASLPRSRVLRPSSSSQEQPRGRRAAAATPGSWRSAGRAGRVRGGRGRFSVGSRTLASARAMTTRMRRTLCAKGGRRPTRTRSSSPRRPLGQSAGTCSASAKPWCVPPHRLLSVHPVTT